MGYVVGSLFVQKFINMDTKYTAYAAVCVLVPGPKAYLLSQTNAIKVCIHLPILGKRKRKKLKLKAEKNKSPQTKIKLEPPIKKEREVKKRKRNDLNVLDLCSGDDPRSEFEFDFHRDC